MRIPLVKTNYFPNYFRPWSFSRDMSSLRFTSAEWYLTSFYDWRQLFWTICRNKNNGGERKVCMKWIQFRSWFRPSEAKVSSFIIQKFSRSFSLSFNVSVDVVVQIFLSCSMITTFPWMLKAWSCLLKCLQAGIALGFLTSFLRLLSLMWNGVLVFLIYQRIGCCKYSILVDK